MACPDGHEHADGRTGDGLEPAGEGGQVLDILTQRRSAKETRLARLGGRKHHSLQS